MINIKQKGNFSKLEKYMDLLTKKSRFKNEAYPIAERCLQKLKNATPVDTGLTANSWSYEIKVKGDVTTITFLNKNLQNGLNVAVLLQYGHMMPTGVWIEGKNYIDPIIKEEYLNVVNNTWKEMVSL